jgi:putative transposase
MKPFSRTEWSEESQQVSPSRHPSRVHRTRQAAAERPSRAHAQDTQGRGHSTRAASQRGQQRRFNIFRAEYNELRPHEALDMRTPASRYEPSPRAMPARLPSFQYPDRFETRYVSANGGIRCNSLWVNVSTVCIGEYVGLEEIDDSIWDVYLGPLKLGRLLERHMRIEDAYGRLKRQHK